MAIGEAFEGSKRKHILLITNHGCHSPIIRVTTDTGGQNFYVNELAKSLVELGYKVTILNRGGYNHPVTGEFHRGTVYYDKVWEEIGKFCRLMYLEDSKKEFVPKEELTRENLEEEADFFFENAAGIEDISFISSHYWDAGLLGKIISERIREKRGREVPNIWTPHSLGILKKTNIETSGKSAEEVRDELNKLRMGDRIAYEEEVIGSASAVVSTSGGIRETFGKYETSAKTYLWFPPGIDTKEFRPRHISECEKALDILEKNSNLKLEREDIIRLLKENIVLLEVSRTVKSKQKDLLLHAFSKIKNSDKAIFILVYDEGSPIFEEIEKLASSLSNRDRMVLVKGSFRVDEMSQVFSLADIYVTASIMEGWGMSVQQGASSKCAIISSNFVPFVTQVLKEVAIVVKEQSPEGYAREMDFLIENPEERENLAKEAFRISLENAWPSLTKEFLLEMKRKKIIESEV